jgi:hypothetical protein
MPAPGYDARFVAVVAFWTAVDPIAVEIWEPVAAAGGPDVEKKASPLKGVTPLSVLAEPAAE